MDNDKIYKIYIFFISIIISISLSLLLLINSLVDTLWYFGGNKFFPENYSFNERVSKINVYLVSPNKFDCIIFGSSRVTLLDASVLKGSNCFNFSFSDGTPEEFIYYAQYIKKFGKLPNKIIIGVDARYYSRKTSVLNVPDFVKALELPPSFIKLYLSADALNFTVRTLQKNPPRLRYYTNELIGDLLPRATDYVPPECFTPAGFSMPFTNKNIHYINKIKKILKSDMVVGYVAPISAWDMLPLIEDGEIDSYMNLIYELSKKFNEFYDFSIPSSLTKRLDNNYDGHHFNRLANNLIAKVMNGDANNIGLPLHKLSKGEYKRSFMRAMNKFMAKVGVRKKSSWDCPHRSAVR